MYSTKEFTCNGRTYIPPNKPVAVICIDGCADEYLSVSMAQAKLPAIEKIAKQGYRGFCRGALPSFTNVNNAAIVTGVPPKQTGICGNFFLDPETGEEVMMNDPKFLQCETILTAAEKAGRKVAFVTAKDKLRALFGIGIENGIQFSAEKADISKEICGYDAEAEIGPKPNIYSGDASVYAIEAGVKLLEAGKADFMYLSLTDYMQHAYAPEEKESLEFYAQLDEQIGKLLDLGCVVAITADHGMNAKIQSDGTPNVIWLETLLQEKFGENAKVICPITDPYVVHHGALGSAVTVHLFGDLANDEKRKEIMQWLLTIEGITEIYDKKTAESHLELLPERIGDIYVLSSRNKVLGRRPDAHDIGALKKTLRSHGGRYEEMVPLLVSEPLNETYHKISQGDPRNFDIFAFACNAAQ